MRNFDHSQVFGEGKMKVHSRDGFYYTRLFRFVLMNQRSVSIMARVQWTLIKAVVLAAV